MTIAHLSDLQLARGLMEGDPATFKQGYSAENAALAVQDLRHRSDAEREALLSALIEAAHA